MRCGGDGTRKCDRTSANLQRAKGGSEVRRLSPRRSRRNAATMPADDVYLEDGPAPRNQDIRRTPNYRQPLVAHRISCKCNHGFKGLGRGWTYNVCHQTPASPGHVANLVSSGPRWQSSSSYKQRGRAMYKMFLVAISACVTAATFAPLHAADEPVVVISRFFIAQGKEAIFEERNRKIVEYVRKAEPDIVYRLQRSKRDPSQYVYYEVYPSQAALERHSKQILPVVLKELGPPPEGLLARPRENETLQVLEP